MFEITDILLILIVGGIFASFLAFGEQLGGAIIESILRLKQWNDNAEELEERSR